MRFESLEIDRATPFGTSIRFPAWGLGIGASSNDSGKSALAHALADALFGEERSARHSRSGPENERPSRLLLHVALDAGTTLAIARDLAHGTLRITDSAGIDRTTELLGDPARTSPGEALLGLTRREFERVAVLSLDNLHALEGDASVARLLGVPRGTPRREASRLEEPEPPPRRDPVSMPPSTRAVPEQAIDEVRRRKRELDELTQALEGKESELRLRSTSVEELRAEIERIGALSGAEPKDAQKLGALLDVLKRGAESKEQLRRDELKFKRELTERGLSSERLARLQQLFEKLEPADQEFLESYRRSDTLHRGNQALVKSESRFDESRLGDITKERETSSRHAVWPFALSVICVSTSISLRLFSLHPLFSLAALFLAIAAVGLGVYLFLRARGLRESERTQLQRALEMKRAQLSELEKEQRYASGRLALLADARKLGGPRELLDLHEEWMSSRGELGATRAFEVRRLEIEKEMAAVREKLGSFTPANPGTAASFGTVAEWETLHRDYLRHFEAQKDLAAASAALDQVEEELSSLETVRAEVRESIEDVLQNAGIDPTKDLDEAIERLAMREWTGEFADSDAVRADAGADADVDAAERRADAAFGIPLEEPRLEDRSWQASVSARAEAILRRIVPEVRAVEVDRRLGLSLQLDARGPRLAGDALRSALSPAGLDQARFALRLAVAETLSAGGERIPLLLDDPLVRSDDARYDRALQLLVEDAGEKGQIVLFTCHEVRTNWFLEQHPGMRSRVTSLGDASAISTQEAPAAAAAPAAPTAPAAPAISAAPTKLAPPA